MVQIQQLYCLTSHNKKNNKKYRSYNYIQKDTDTEQQEKLRENNENDKTKA